MAIARLAITLDEDLAARVRADADQVTHGNVSAWIAEAIQERLRLRAMDEAVAAFEAEHGQITEDELVQAERRLVEAERGWPRS